MSCRFEKDAPRLLQGMASKGSGVRMSRCGGQIKPRVAVAVLTLALCGDSTAAVAQNAAALDRVVLKGLMSEGASVYGNRCAKCHGRKGEGQQHSHDAAPRLAGNFAKLSAEEIAVRIIKGGAYMPPFASLTDREIAAVATYVRNSFGNDLGVAIEAEVAEVR